MFSSLRRTLKNHLKYWSKLRMEMPPNKRIKLDNDIEKSPGEITNNENESNLIVLEDFFDRFPHLTEEIFGHLKSTSLAKCREVSKIWQNYLDQQKLLQARIIRCTIEKHDIRNQGHFEESWEKVLNKSSTKMVFDLGIVLKEAYNFLIDKKWGAVLTTPLHVAAIKGNLNFYQYLMGKSMHVNPRNNSTGMTPLHLAAHNGHLNLFIYICDLIENKLPNDAFGVSPFHAAVFGGKLDVCKYIVDNFIKQLPRDNSGETPLHWAVKGGHFEILKYIMTNVENKEKNPRSPGLGLTPLHMAAGMGNLEMCKYILENIEQDQKSPRTDDGKSPLHVAAINGRLEVCKYMMTIPELKNSRTNFNHTPLHYAASCGHLEVCKYIMEHTRKKSPRSNSGKTPLHSAALHGQLEICKYILDNVKNINPRCHNGQTPLDIAHNRKHFQIFELISQHIERAVLKKRKTIVISKFNLKWGGWVKRTEKRK